MLSRTIDALGQALSGPLEVSPPLQHEDPVNSAAFSPDGARVVTASDDKTARVWDAATGAPIGKPLQHEDTVSSAAFSPDGDAGGDRVRRQDRAGVGRGDRGADRQTLAARGCGRRARRSAPTASGW